MPDLNELIAVPSYHVWVLKTAPYTVYRAGRGGELVPVIWRLRGGRYTYAGSRHHLFRSVVIAAAFHKKPAGIHRVRHKDGDVTNDHPDNLYWHVRNPAAYWTAQGKEFRSKNVFLLFGSLADGGRQHWCQRSKVAHLIDLKPNERGPFKEEYAAERRRPRKEDQF